MVSLASYSQEAYLSYAMSVVKGRALPSTSDGQKPVQRRIMFAMHRMGLNDRDKPVKSARVVGEVLGKYHAHGDTSVYDAAVRMARKFVMRYPLVDGQGSFGSRDGDGAAAMRYTEARLTRFAELLLDELDMGTVDFTPNYDGTLLEPVMLPARLPMLLLNGASGIAVGMATEVPSHNLVEVANACALLLKNPEASLEDVLQVLPGPDFPCGGQIISSPEDILKAYSTGRGAFRTRARWKVENLARGQWQIVVTELPPASSTAAVMEEIEAMSNPQVKAGKKTLTQQQLNLKALILSKVDKLRDDSDANEPVRLVIEPKSSRLSPDDVMQTLLAHTSMEANVPLNLTSLSDDNTPGQRGLLTVLQDWIAFRLRTVERRILHRLAQIDARTHILDGRIKAWDMLTEVIRIIREEESPTAELMAKHGFSEIQAKDLLEIRLRQLARLEKMKLDDERTNLLDEKAMLQAQIASEDTLRAQVLKEVKADCAKYGDERRTLMEVSARITTSDVAETSSEPVTLIVSKQGWLRARVGHKADLSSLGYKPGDEALTVAECRTCDTVVFFDDTGRAYNVAAAAFPSGRGDGTPLSSLVNLGSNRLVYAFVLNADAHYFLSSTGGYGFLCPAKDLVTRQKAGKNVFDLTSVEEMMAPVELFDVDGGEIVVANNAGKILFFPAHELKRMAKGRGMQLMNLKLNEDLTLSTALEAPAQTATLKLQLKTSVADLPVDDLADAKGKRARAGNRYSNSGYVVGIEVTSSAPSYAKAVKQERPATGNEDRDEAEEAIADAAAATQPPEESWKAAVGPDALSLDDMI